ncbi:hypothetical protein CCR75_006249 [Bremia lactucae]|uniref:Uncharacterized protein n=1 Tax=Bremia lactucae TaxID=4779 RepID=A0A976FNK8_BRELC|nr:hypothetical protein CCR75_006249 [Bremia lactucae]
MTFSSTLQLRLFENHSLDKKLECSREFTEKDDDINWDRRYSISSDGKWPSFKRQDIYLDDPQTTIDTAFQANSNAMVSCDGSGATVHSDWHAISSNSFDETCLENEYGCWASMPTSNTSLTHLNEPIHKLTLENEDHDMPVISMPYPGSTWFMGNKPESGFCLPSLGGLTPRLQASSAVATAIGCASSLRSGSVDFSLTTGKLVSDPSTVQVEPFAPCLPPTLEPSELLFEDMTTWSGPPPDPYDNQHYHEQQEQPFENVMTDPSTSSGYLYDDGTSSNNAMATGLHEYAPPYQRLLHSNVSAGPLLNGTMPPHDIYPTETHWSSNQSPPYYSTSLPSCTTPIESMNNQYIVSDHSSSNLNEGPNLKRMVLNSTHHQNVSNQPQSTECGEPIESSSPLLSNTTSSSKIQLLTALNNCYWKNGRKNLQCFPSCPEHHDFYSMKMNNRKHSSVGVCRGPVYCHAFTDAADFLPAASTQHMKQDHRAGLFPGHRDARELFVLGRFERVPQQDTTNLLEELNSPLTFSNAATFEQFRFTCFQAVEMEERRVLMPQATNVVDVTKAVDSPKKRFLRSTWFFLPDVWKVQPMLKKKRKATRSAPAQTFPFCFRIFIYRRHLNGPGYSCIADTASSFFELYSTRTVDRVKRKYWSSDSSSDQGVAKH